MKHLLVSLRIFAVWTVITGILYPVFITLVGQLLFPNQSSGLIAQVAGKPVGSELIAQKFESEKYFWPRPSAIDFAPLPSGGSNFGQAAADLKKLVDARLEKLNKSHDGAARPPQDLLFASGSGLDPHISPEAAQYQVARIARVRGFPIEKVKEIVEKSIEGRQWGVFGEPRVNVLRLNLKLDQI